jgi:hypothetical protein
LTIFFNHQLSLTDFIVCSNFNINRNLTVNLLKTPDLIYSLISSTFHISILCPNLIFFFLLISLFRSYFFLFFGLYFLNFLFNLLVLTLYFEYRILQKDIKFRFSYIFNQNIYIFRETVLTLYFIFKLFLYLLTAGIFKLLIITN